MAQQSVNYYLDSENRFVVENYNWAKPFSNFFPGIAGKWGAPIWVYYVNRSQCISTLGVKDKDHAIMEFYPFNKALQLTSQQGFRTFLKTEDRRLYEPFQRKKKEEIKQKMLISSEELEIDEVNSELGMETNVLYFPLASEPVPALVRKLKVKNLNDQPLELELIDGLPRILPHGLNQDHVKFTARHIEAMMGIEWANDVPLFRLKQSPEDIAQIEKIPGGNFYLSLLGREKISSDNLIVDPDVIFGESGSYEHPWTFESNSLQSILGMEETQENKTPCAFTALPLELSPGEEIILYSMIGNVSEEEKLRLLLESVEQKDFFPQKRKKNREVIDEVKNYTFTVSSSKEFDQYCQQTFLDNVIRGGMPLVFDTASDESVMYLYSRKNGGLERDYHHFVLEPTYLSQGNGHYRSFLQNHLTDTWFFPEVEDLNTSTFLNLIQTDGYNPQIITRRTYTAEDTDGLEEWLKDIVEDEELHNKLIEMVSEPFAPGEFIMKLEEGEGQVPQDYERNIRNLLRFCRENDVGDLHEGFWIDHWTYNLDLIDNFLEIYPEKLKETLIDRKTYTFYDNPDFVKPRDEKHVLADGQVRQYNAVARSSEKLRMIEDRDVYPTRMRADYGDGEIYRTNLLVKLLTLLANKIATLDPQGIGTEMEAGQPGWCDSLNGLPGLLGSSLCETLELKRLCQFIRGSLDRTDLEDECSIALYEELHDLMTGLSGAIDKRLESDSDEKALNYWRESNQLKEQYRKKTKMGISGQEEEMTVAEVNSFLNKCLELLDEIFKPENKEKILDENGVPYTYFINEVEKYEPIWKDEKEEIPKTGPSGQPLVRAKKFSQKPVPLFLEGPVHFSRVSQEDSKEVYGSVRESQLYDEKLKMYKNCESLEEEPFEIGRIRAYARGWIENESIYLHMEYKWLLELLRTGLYEEFFQEIENTLIPFLDPETYGRSILEGGSFIVSSAFPDEKLHGRCFQPRLSGVTNEMLRIWTWMAAGKNPFSLDENGQIKLGLRPILPSWLFTQEKKTARYYGSEGNVSDVTIQENAFAFKFLGRTLVVYHNEERKDTFGDDGAQAESYRLKYHDGTERTVTEGTLGPSMAEDVRNGRVERIDVLLS